jgi:pentatricopeptide repeat protein
VLFHGQAIKLGIGSKDNVQNALISVYFVCGLIRCAWKVFDEILERTMVSWKSMIGGYSKMGCRKEAFFVVSGDEKIWDGIGA